MTHPFDDAKRALDYIEAAIQAGRDTPDFIAIMPPPEQAPHPEAIVVWYAGLPCSPGTQQLYDWARCSKGCIPFGDMKSRNDLSRMAHAVAMEHGWAFMDVGGA